MDVFIVVMKDFLFRHFFLFVCRYIGSTNLGGIYQIVRVGMREKKYSPVTLPDYLMAQHHLPLHEVS